jgi:hypothetical protein
MVKKRLEHIITELGRTFDGDEFDTFFIPTKRRFSSDADLKASTSGLTEYRVTLYRQLHAAMLGNLPLSQMAEQNSRVTETLQRPPWRAPSRSIDEQELSWELYCRE